MATEWIAERETVTPDESVKVVIKAKNRPLTFEEVIAGWRDDASFRNFYFATLATTPWPAFFWEMPPVRSGQTRAPYEFMLIRSGALARMLPDTGAFAEQFRSTSKFVATFPNLGGDAMLVAPEQVAAPAAYAHLAAFVRSAPHAQQHELFRAQAQAVDRFLRDTDGRLWISTSGLGIAWLHIRLDTVPKYYQHEPYARM